MIFVFILQIAILGGLPFNGYRMKKYARVSLIIFSAFVLFLLVYTFFKFQDRHPDNNLNISYKNFEEREINSVGPETAPILHKNMLEILKNFTSNKP
ncbi:hypothetical protein B879_01662 [Cecembia lonarensis LW9]|uniref:Uncharacterized protein n=1 Tax=Cecembia lonarensis (strain CCUG 58316 / KCTC 22772 / LW9) TaxID=1225176 RepID=K1L098_CECL9|nr:hypothetical protein B879_01662 [Cecembia lonarensis LW9]